MEQEIMEHIASVIKYGVPDHVFIQLEKAKISQVIKIIGKLDKDLQEYSCTVFIIKKKVKWEEYKKNLESTPAEKVIFVIETRFIPTGKEADRLFYCLSRIGEMSGFNIDKIRQKSVSCIIIGENPRFIRKLSQATNSSLGLKFLEFAKDGQGEGGKNE